MIFEKDKIIKILNNDGIIAFVTDTVWGIGCLPTSERGCKRIYEIKKRDQRKPLILMSNSIYNLVKYVESVPAKADEYINQYIPGALTLVMKKSERVPNWLSTNMDTIGIIVPKNDTFKALCDFIPGRVLATTSANVSGESPALTYEDVVRDYNLKVDYVVEDFGNKATGVASTVAGVFDDETVIFRQGKIKL